MIYRFLFTFLLFFAVEHSIAQFQDNSARLNLLHRPESESLFGGGVCFLDANNDGLIDVFLPGGNMENGFFLNVGKNGFVDYTKNSGLSNTIGTAHTFGAVSGDFDRDGCADLFVTTFSDRFANQLYLGNCKGQFLNRSDEYGITHLGNSTAATLLDYNGDGFLDIYVTNYILKADFIRDEEDNVVGYNHTCEGNFFYLNQSGSSFIEVSGSLGLDDAGCGLATVAFDINHDNLQDIIVCNDFGEWVKGNAVLINQGMKTVALDEAVRYGLDLNIYGMGVSIGDYNNDNLLDMYFTNIGSNYLMRNNGDFYENVANDWAADNTWIEQSNNFTTGWGNFFFDYDNDGDHDLLVANGYIPSAPFLNNGVLDDNVLLMNSGSTYEPIKFFDNPLNKEFNRGAAYADIDNDGDLDFIISTLFREVLSDSYSILMNNIQGGSNNWIQFKLQGDDSNIDGYGAIAIVYSNDIIRTAVSVSGSSHASQNANILHFGLRSNQIVDSVKISWPSGKVTNFYGLLVNNKYLLQENSTEALVVGCKDTNSAYYNPDAQISETCYDYILEGCTDSNSPFYNPLANVNDNSCSEIVGLENNPNKGVIYFDSKTKSLIFATSYQNYSIQLRSLEGKVLFEENNLSHHFSVELINYARGVYLVNLHSDNEYYTKRLLIH